MSADTRSQCHVSNLQQSRSTAVINKFRAPKGNVNMERSYEICRAVVQKSANKNIIAEQVTLRPSPPVSVAALSSASSQGHGLQGQPRVEFLAPTTIMTTVPTVTAAAPTVILAPVNPVPSTSAAAPPLAVAARPPPPPSVSVVVTASPLTSTKVGYSYCVVSLDMMMSEDEGRTAPFREFHIPMAARQTAETAGTETRRDAHERRAIFNLDLEARENLLYSFF